ncbi:2-oxo acid dehydrogenase subunit E2 [Pikeienuella piscinae]|uniref:Dihydrolipoamide acetyltransferase component of pyruvate dehydrogenase complex n=1 Tax=Pikeienuella piscinae TaxID=2748098 RepID=A0A7L5BX62_9RHOB|nr:dihydrolipoamide acetyltransferase family protein [Pikeienuella piscinae]QIE54179.1 2-oxo acid dehydrogenase subunit E2 [Pikeienuella piscinae]
MPVEVIMPKVDMDMAEGVVAVWHVAEGGKVEKGSALFDIETDKATMEVESPATGILRRVTATPGDTVPIGAVVALIQTEGEAEPAAEMVTPSREAPNRRAEPDRATATRPEPASPRDQKALQDDGKLRASPLARRLARERGVMLERIAGSGPRGRITRSDVEAEAAAVSAPVASTDPRAIADRLGLGHRLEPISRMRRVIARRLTESKTTVPHFYLEAEIRLDPLLTLRSQINSGLAALGGSSRVSVTHCLARAAALALIEVPEANASWAGETILHYDAAQISVAVAVDGGLVTPVLRDADQKSLVDLAGELSDLTERAHAGELSSEAMQGGSMSLSNLGMFGVRRFSAIINPPESMILAVGRGERRFLVGDDDQPVAATMMSLTLSCDHRVVDGALGARWLESFRNFVEQPANLLGSGLKTGR